MTPDDYWDFEIGHITSLRPCDLGSVRPPDLLGASDLYDHLYRRKD